MAYSKQVLTNETEACIINIKEHGSALPRQVKKNGELDYYFTLYLKLMTHIGTIN